MHLSCVFDIVVLGACFLLENVFSQFFIFNIRISKSSESTKININLMFFQAKHTFKIHQRTISNVKTNNIKEEEEIFILIFAYVTRQTMRKITKIKKKLM